MTRTFTIVTTVLVTALTIAAGAVEAKTVLKVGHVLSVGSPLDQGINKWAELVAEKSNGDLELQVFPAGQLGNALDQIENLSAGSQDLMVEHLIFYSNFDKRFGVLNLPYLFASRDHLRKFLTSPRFHEMLASLEQSRGLAFLGADRPNWMYMTDRTLLARRPVMVPDDLDGVKLRMYEARVPVLSWETLGAKIIILPWGETYTGLATGTVDAITARVEAHYQMKQTEIAKYMTITKEFYQSSIPVISAKTAAKLSAEQMAILEDAAREAGDHFTNVTSALANEFYDKVIEEHGVTVIRVPVGPWQKKIQAAYPTFEKEGIVPAGMIEYVQGLK